MTLLFLILLLAGAICFAMAAFGTPVRRVYLPGLGLLFWILVPLLQTIQKV